MAKGEVHAAWMRENTVSLNFRLNKNTDADVIEHLDKQENKRGYIKRLIRQDIEAQRKG